MNNLTNPAWLTQYISNYKNIREIPDELYLSINRKIDKLSGPTPEVSIIIPVWNEEANILSTISSLADSVTRIPVEFIIINNNSTDKTQAVINRLKVKAYMQPIQGCGPARQVGLEHARGKYILSADADCIYPPGWIDGMINALENRGVVCVYGRYSFIGGAYSKRWKLFIYEKMKNVIIKIRHKKRPFLNTLGMNMAFLRESALKVGYIMENVRGEDGRLALSLMQFGKVVFVKDESCTIWTGTRTIAHKSLVRTLFGRVIGSLLNMTIYLKKPAP